MFDPVVPLLPSSSRACEGSPGAAGTRAENVPLRGRFLTPFGMTTRLGCLLEMPGSQP